jgi:hypothetical protein
MLRDQVQDPSPGIRMQNGLRCGTLCELYRRQSEKRQRTEERNCEDDLARMHLNHGNTVIVRETSKKLHAPCQKGRRMNARRVVILAGCGECSVSGSKSSALASALTLGTRVGSYPPVIKTFPFRRRVAAWTIRPVVI